MHRLMGLVLLVSLVTRCPAAVNHYPDPVYLSTESLGRVALLPPVPKRHDATDRADFEKLLEYQRTRSPEDVKRAAAVVDIKLATLFGPPWGPLTAAEVERFAPFFTKVQIDVDYWVQETKKLQGRLRPYLADKRIQPCVYREWTRAYPSGHAAISRVQARLLALLLPAKEVALRARAERIAEDRVLAGVHHPSDIYAGKILGEKVLHALWGNAPFRRDFDRLLRAERRHQ